MLRYSKGVVGPAVPAVGTVGGMDVLRKADAPVPDVLLVSVGALAPMCLEIAGLLVQIHTLLFDGIGLLLTALHHDAKVSPLLGWYQTHKAKRKNGAQGGQHIACWFKNPDLATGCLDDFQLLLAAKMFEEVHDVGWTRSRTMKSICLHNKINEGEDEAQNIQ